LTQGPHQIWELKSVKSEIRAWRVGTIIVAVVAVDMSSEGSEEEDYVRVDEDCGTDENQ
jgi:hypothetical protein